MKTAIGLTAALTLTDAMKDHADTHAIDLLMVGPLIPEIIAYLEGKYRLHKWWTIEDKEAFLREHGATVRGIVTSGRFGATKTLIDSLPALEVINSFGVGYDPIGIDAARARIIANAGGQTSHHSYLVTDPLFGHPSPWRTMFGNCRLMVSFV